MAGGHKTNSCCIVSPACNTAWQCGCLCTTYQSLMIHGVCERKVYASFTPCICVGMCNQDSLRALQMKHQRQTIARLRLAHSAVLPIVLPHLSWASTGVSNAVLLSGMDNTASNVLHTSHTTSKSPCRSHNCTLLLSRPATELPAALFCCCRCFAAAAAAAAAASSMLLLPSPAPGVFASLCSGHYLRGVLQRQQRGQQQHLACCSTPGISPVHIRRFPRL
jgi:hypothetical protein